MTNREDQLLNRSEIIPSRTDVLSIALEAGIDGVIQTTSGRSVVIDMRKIERFAALIASRVAEHIRETEFKPDWNNYRQGFADGAAEEREACAKVLDHMADEMVREMEPSTAVAWVQSKAASIRARGQA